MSRLHWASDMVEVFAVDMCLKGGCGLCSLFLNLKRLRVVSLNLSKMERLGLLSSFECRNLDFKRSLYFVYDCLGPNALLFEVLETAGFEQPSLDLSAFKGVS